MIQGKRLLFSMTKNAMYKTVQVARALPGIEAGEYVSIVKFHEGNGTFTISSISGVLQCMVDPTCLEGFCL